MGREPTSGPKRALTPSCRGYTQSPARLHSPPSRPARRRRRAPLHTAAPPPTQSSPGRHHSLPSGLHTLRAPPPRAGAPPSGVRSSGLPTTSPVPVPGVQTSGAPRRRDARAHPSRGLARRASLDWRLLLVSPSPRGGVYFLAAAITAPHTCRTGRASCPSSPRRRRDPPGLDGVAGARAHGPRAGGGAGPRARRPGGPVGAAARRGDARAAGTSGARARRPSSASTARRGRTSGRRPGSSRRGRCPW